MLDEDHSWISGQVHRWRRVPVQLGDSDSSEINLEHRQGPDLEMNRMLWWVLAKTLSVIIMEMVTATSDILDSHSAFIHRLVLGSCLPVCAKKKTDNFERILINRHRLDIFDCSCTVTERFFIFEISPLVIFDKEKDRLKIERPDKRSTYCFVYAIRMLSFIRSNHDTSVSASHHG